MEQVLVSGISADELFKKFEQLIDVKLSQTRGQGIREKEKDWITRIETADILSISLPTLNDWTKEGKLKSYKMGNRVYYRLTEVRDAISATSVLKHKKTLPKSSW